MFVCATKRCGTCIFVDLGQGEGRVEVGPHCVVQNGLECVDQASSNSQPAFASQALVLKACATTLTESSYSAELQNESNLRQLPGKTNTDLLSLASLQGAQSAGQIQRQLCKTGSVDDFLEIISIDTRICFSWNCLNLALGRLGSLRLQPRSHTWRNKPWFHSQRHRWF